MHKHSIVTQLTKFYENLYGIERRNKWQHGEVDQNQQKIALMQEEILPLIVQWIYLSTLTKISAYLEVDVVYWPQLYKDREIEGYHLEVK